MITNPSTARSILRVFAAAAVAIAMAASAQAQSTWTGAANSTWSDAGNWTNAVPSTTTGTAVFTSSASQTTITNGGRIDFRSLVFRSGALAYTLGPNFGINGTPATITVESGVSNDQTISGNVRNAAGTTATITNNGTGLLNFSGQFLSGGAWTVTFDGPGNITAGSIQQSGTGYLFSFVKAGSGTLTINTGLGSAPTGPSGAGYYTGSTTINGGVLQLGNSLSLGSGTGAITFGGGTLRYGSATVDYSSRIRSSGSAIAIDTGTLAAVTFASALPASNSGGLTKLGSGTLTLSAANLYTGTTTISAGQLSLSGGDNRLAAASPITITGGVLDLGNRGQSTSGAISFQGGTVQSGTLTSTGGAFDGQAGTVSAILAGSGIGLTKTTSGTLTLTGANTYSGNTAINAGVLAMNNASSLGAGSDPVTFGGGTLLYGPSITTDLSARIASSSSAISVDVGGNNVTWATALASTNVGGLTKLGSGLLTFTSNNSYSGATAVDVGGLLVNGANSGSGLVTVANAARIGGDGSLAGGLSLLSGAQFVFDPLATLDVTGAVTLDNSFGVSSLVNADGTAINWASIATGTYTLINTTSTFGNIANFGVANAAPIDAGRTAYFQDGSLQLVVVPEPSTFALAGLGLAAAAAWARRRR